MESRPEEPATPTATVTAPRDRPTGRAFAIAALTFLAGPPLGALPFYALLFGSLLSSEAQPATSVDLVETILKVALFIALYSYVLGGLQALVAGALMGIQTWRRGTVSYWEAIMIALLVSAAGTALVFAVGTFVEPRDYAGDLSLAGMLAVLSVLAAVLCRFIAGRIGIFPRA